LSEDDKIHLDFLKDFEHKFISQGQYESRDLYDSLNLAWKLLSLYPKDSLTKISDKIKDKFHNKRLLEEDE